MAVRPLLCWLFFAQLLFPAAALADDTHLRIIFRGLGNEPIAISRAELLVVAWGLTERVPLRAGGNTLDIDMSESWFRTQPNVASRLRDMEGVFLYVQAAGYAPVRSNAFLWVGAHGGDYGLPRVTTTTVIMSGGAPVTISEGTTVEAAVALRRPETRVLRFVEESGAPAAGLEVNVSMFWSHSNHCGVLAGADPLVAGRTDRHGEMSVPDGEFDYALELRNREPVRYRFVQDGVSGHVLIRLNTTRTTVPLHRVVKHELIVDVRRDGRPVPGLTLMGQVDCPCGACSGQFGQTDVNGRAIDSAFYPEMMVSLWLCDGAQVVWYVDVKDLRPGVVRVSLPWTAPSQQTSNGQRLSTLCERRP